VGLLSEVDAAAAEERAKARRMWVGLLLCPADAGRLAPVRVGVHPFITIVLNRERLSSIFFFIFFNLGLYFRFRVDALSVAESEAVSLRADIAAGTAQARALLPLLSGHAGGSSPGSRSPSPSPQHRAPTLSPSAASAATAACTSSAAFATAAAAAEAEERMRGRHLAEALASASAALARGEAEWGIGQV
jgi:hypothetical protein